MKHFFHSFLGTICAVIVLMVLTFAIGSCVIGQKPKIEDNSWLIVEMAGDLLEYNPPGGIMSEITGGEVETLTRILGNLEKAAVDDRVEGVIFKVSMDSAAGFAKIEEIRGAIKHLQESGKKVYAWAESFSDREYPLLAACDEIYIPPTAYISFKGVGMEMMHVKNALDKLGIKPNVHKIKDYKSAAELVIRADSSEPAKENRRWLMNDVLDEFHRILLEERGLDRPKVEELMQHALFTGEEALEAGLVDGLKYWDELEAGLKQEDEDELVTLAQGRYADVPPGKLGLEGDSKIAVIHAQGTIIGRTSGVNPLLGITMGHESIVAEFRRARMDEDVAAIVFRVDSGGGDALGSDLMGHEVEVTAGVKPVVVSMVDVAASGGYHIAYRSTHMMADPMSIVGSIGSINGKFNMKGFYDKLGITYDTLEFGPMALLDSDLRDYTPEEKARVEEDHWAGFNAWLQDVADHRDMTFEEAEKLAHGRVFTGRQALENGLIDELGDMARAIEVARELAEIPADDKVTVEHFPIKAGPLQAILGGDDAASAAANWLIYRSVRERASETMEILATRTEQVY